MSSGTGFLLLCNLLESGISLMNLVSPAETVRILMYGQQVMSQLLPVMIFLLTVLKHQFYF